MTWTIDDWHNCYREGWGELLTARSYGHPAKLRFGLAAKIYQHILEEGWAQAGSRVVDCFGGVGGTAFHAMFYGMDWTGVELSHRFRGNLDVWKDRGLPGTGRIIQGDSRELSKILADAQVAIASPPYADKQFGGGGDKHDKVIDAMKDGYGSTPGNLGNLPATESGFKLVLSSPPYADQQVGTGGEGHKGWRGYTDHGGGTSADPAQLSAMPATQDGFNASIASPPYNLPFSQDHNGSRSGDRGTNPSEPGAFARYGNTEGQLEGMKSSEDGFNIALASPPFAGSQQVDNREQPSSAMSRQGEITPGTSDGQLAEMKDGGFDVAVASPPYETGGHHDHQMDAWNTNGRGQTDQNRGISKGYADESDKQMARDFWAAAKQIVAETYKVLLPGAHAVWVVKSYVKDSKIVDFPDQWRQLCESVGFKTLHEHRAWVVEKTGEQMTIDGDVESIEIQRKSFFRLLQERKGSPEINWETVYCMIKL